MTTKSKSEIDKCNYITHLTILFMEAYDERYTLLCFGENTVYCYYTEDGEEMYCTFTVSNLCDSIRAYGFDINPLDYREWANECDAMDTEIKIRTKKPKDIFDGGGYKYADEYINTYYPTKNNKNTTKGTTMSKTKEIIKNNTDSATQAMKMKLGNEVIKNVKKAIKPHVPMMIRGYLDSPFADVIIANIFITAQKQLKPDSDVLQSLSVATLDVAMYNVANLVDFDAILEKVTNGMDLTPLKKKK